MWNRLSGRPDRRSKRRNLDVARMIELLEDRTLLSAAPFDGVPPLAIDPGAFATDSILVRYKDGAQPDAASPSRVENLSSIVPGLRLVHLGQGVTVVDALASYNADPNVLYAEPNYRVSIQLTPNDPQFDDLWGLNNTGQTFGTSDSDIDAVEAWSFATGSGNTIVAVIDTGVDYTHEDLAANMWVNQGEIPGNGIDDDQNGFVDDVHGYDFANNDGDPMDDHYHGTHVAGSIGAVGNNGIGVVGVNWNVQIMGLKFLDATGNGDIADAISALNYAVANGAKISNNSWGFSGQASQALNDAIENAQSAGHIFVAAAGNGDIFGFGIDNDSTPFWPGNIDLDNVVTVAATDHNDNLAIFSNYGATTVDLAAPGVDILSTVPNNGYDLLSGTSMATPHVAGAIALLWDTYPELTYYEVIDRIFESVDPVSGLQGRMTTGGRLNVDAALALGITGPRVVSTNPEGSEMWPVSQYRVRFSEPMNTATFTTDDVVSFTGPNGAIAITGVNPVAGTDGREFEITFAEQGEFGNYQMVLGPNIADLSGELMDQDRDQTSGEVIDDRFTGTFEIIPFSASFDFGTTTSPLEAGYTPVTPETSYSQAEGFGWGSGSIIGTSRGTGTALTRDLNFSSDMTFLTDVPDGNYNVTLTIGDTGGYPHDQMAVFIEGLQVDTINTAAGQVLTKTYQATVSDGQLTFRLLDLGGADANAVINGLELSFLGADLSGPRVVQHSSAAMGTVDRVSVTFNEAIDAATFTLADVVSLNGPSGAITPTAVNQLDDAKFEILFAEQSAEGIYAFTIGPDIADLAGNLMDQDQDGDGGEAVQDQFTGALSLAPFSAQFDFGKSNSPVETGWQQVTDTTLYSASQGFGWVNSVLAVDRSSGTALARDLNFGNDMTFLSDIPSGNYEIELTIGDMGGFAHDQIGVFIEGSQVDTINTAPSQVLTETYQATVSDGQLTFRLLDLGGSDPSAVINGLKLVALGPDTSGPHVVATTPSSTAAGSVDRITLTFNEAIDAATFTLADVISLTGPAGAITPTAVNQLDDAVFEILFAEQTAQGSYAFTVGPNIADLAGNLMDQDQDGTGGEAVEDQFSSTFSLEPLSVQFDFGTSSSPVEAGWQQVTNTTTYNASQGFGWLNSVAGINRYSGTALTRDLNFGGDMTFLTDVADGNYEVTLTIGDTAYYTHDQMAIFIEGVQVDTITTPRSQVLTKTYQASVSDGQLTFRLLDLGGSDVNAVINGLEIVSLGPDTTGPQVVATSPSPTVAGSVDRITLTFNEAIDAATFTLADVASLTGPAGAITPTAVNQLDDAVFEILFAEQTAQGSYTFTIGPNIADPAGNLMDQDQDGTGGEAVEDQFTGGFTLEGFSAQFDFGTSSSPVQSGWQQVTNTTTYNASQGFGWLNSVLGINRYSGTALARDLNFGSDMTFLTDVPDGTYEVTLTIGDTAGYAHDQMAVFIEGVQVDTISTAPSQVLTKTYQASVSDGQLTFRLQDLGGSDANAVINGLEVHEVGQASGSQIMSLSTTSDTSFGQSSIGSALPPVVFLQDAAPPLGNPQIDDDARALQTTPRPIGQPIADHPVIDQLFSKDLPDILDALQGLGSAI